MEQPEIIAVWHAGKRSKSNVRDARNNENSRKRHLKHSVSERSVVSFAETILFRRQRDANISDGIEFDVTITRDERSDKSRFSIFYKKLIVICSTLSINLQCLEINWFSN